MLKKVFFQLHWLFGITAGLILALMGVTGAIYSYEQQILKWINPDSYTVQVENRPKLNPAEIYAHFQQQNPELKINSITLQKAPEAASNINIVKEGERRGLTLMINPYTAELLPEIKGRAFFQFIQQLHRNLTVGPVGKQITGACTLILIFFVLSGLYLRWPKRHSIKQWFLLKPQLKGRNFIWDLHAVIGTWVVIFYLILACTGLYWSYDWWRNGLFQVLGVERPAEQMQAQQHSPPQGEKKSRSEHISPEQIYTALDQTWVGFNQKIQRDYSSISLNIPKKANGEVSIVFVDAVVQHERARNNATFNYQASEITDLSLYEDKKLNEKIMSSMLPVHRGSFFGPVYQFFAMVASLLMPLFFVTGWMLYLKRRKQKRLTAQARQLGQTADIDPHATPWLIVYATQTGVSEQMAWATAHNLQKARQAVEVKALQTLTAEDLKQHPQVLFIVSTYGTGEAPDLAQRFEKNVMQNTPDLSQLKFAVLALGSKDYPESYCAFGHRIAAWLQRCQATALFNTIEVNNTSSTDLERWHQALTTCSGLSLQHISLNKAFEPWTLSERHLLNPNSLGQPAFHLVFKTPSLPIWQAGDIAEIQPQNSKKRIADFAIQHGFNLTKELQEALADKDLSQFTPNSDFKDQLINQLPRLPIREYSIASIPDQQALHLVVRQKILANAELGLGSGWLTQHLAVNEAVQIHIRSNPSFHLIEDACPIICIGNGTGIAGLISLLQARMSKRHTQNWLIFGERQHEHDFFFKQILEDWQNTDQLTHLDLAFSRDQAEKRYVHHILRDRKEQLIKWIEMGAVIYVCGSIQGMATDVDQALREILGDHTVEVLKDTARYRRDVY